MHGLSRPRRSSLCIGRRKIGTLRALRHFVITVSTAIERIDAAHQCESEGINLAARKFACLLNEVQTENGKTDLDWFASSAILLQALNIVQTEIAKFTDGWKQPPTHHVVQLVVEVALLAK